MAELMANTIPKMVKPTTTAMAGFTDNCNAIAIAAGIMANRNIQRLDIAPSGPLC